MLSKYKIDFKPTKDNVSVYGLAAERIGQKAVIDLAKRCYQGDRGELSPKQETDNAQAIMSKQGLVIARYKIGKFPYYLYTDMSLQTTTLLLASESRKFLIESGYQEAPKPAKNTPTTRKITKIKPVGPITISTEASKILSRFKVETSLYTDDHKNLEWGDSNEQEKATNEAILQSGKGQVISRFLMPDNSAMILVATDLTGQGSGQTRVMAAWELNS